MKRTIGNVFIAILTIALIVGNWACYTYFDLITEFLHGSGMSDSFNSEEMQEALAANDELVREMEAEGIVLLRNEKDEF